MNLAGKDAAVTFDQSGTGLIKLTSDILISGYGANKGIVLKGDTAGAGEIAGVIADPHDRTGEALTSVTKSGTGKWTLSGINSYSGPTTVSAGTLSLAHEKSLGENIEVAIQDGATLELDFNGQIQVRKLTLDGRSQSPGRYHAKNASGLIKGAGILNVLP
jgi:autotransporter-associated beta strand protein